MRPGRSFSSRAPVLTCQELVVRIFMCIAGSSSSGMTDAS